MPESLVDNTFVIFGWPVFHQTIDIPSGGYCVPPLTKFLYSYEANFMLGLLNNNEEKLVCFFNFTFLCIR